ncbi:uncharacterized protein LOC142996295 [Genypterus blacodes]|uniref:uncharacterized protein LOC142996295 n=1 Tax=Genypterus blacodes TaxID=154954 RepID=UPI003F75EFAF
MKLILTLIFTLTTGFDVSSEEIEVKGCPGGWVEFICAYKITEKTQVILSSPKRPTTFSTQTDVWEKKNSFYLFNDSRERKLRVAIKKSTQKEEQYKCSFSEKKSNRKRSVKVELEKAEEGCQDPSSQISYRTAKTGITCKRPGREFKATGMFFCKETETVCEEILSITSSTTVSTNEKGFALKSSSNDFNLTISNVTEQHAGDYWCGVVFRGGHRATIKKISLRVQESPHTSTPSVISSSSSSSSYPTAATSPVSPDLGSDDSYNRAFVTSIVAICGALLLLLLLLLIMILTYKRFISSKNRGNGETLNRSKEDGYIYEEIEERPQQPESGTAITSIYATANLPTNPSAFLQYSTVSFPNRPDKADGGTRKPSPSACEYSLASTANYSPRPAEEPLYQTIDKPQQP